MEHEILRRFTAVVVSRAFRKSLIWALGILIKFFPRRISKVPLGHYPRGTGALRGSAGVRWVFRG